MGSDSSLLVHASLWSKSMVAQSGWILASPGELSTLYNGKKTNFHAARLDFQMQ